jgi:hypothetical protein
MHQSIHDTTEAALFEALSSWTWWERTCNWWREACQDAWRQRDLARAQLENGDIYYVVFADKSSKLYCVELKADGPAYASDAVKAAIGCWADTMVFKHQPISNTLNDAVIYTLEEIEERLNA